MLLVAALMLGWIGMGVGGMDPSQCVAPLGMESGRIRDEDIRASSSFDHSNVGPQHGRARVELNGGAWCPQTAAGGDAAHEWLEVDLRSVHLVTAAEVQGRFGNGQGAEWAEAYRLEYWRPRLGRWARCRDALRGNVNTYLPAKSALAAPLLASRVRFLPVSGGGGGRPPARTVCMRVELYGCRWPGAGGVVAYAMPPGDGDFGDASYDGLGRLTDGRRAPDDLDAAMRDPALPAWVGWRNDSRPRAPIEITFEFDRVRAFRAVRIHASNQFGRDVRVFAAATLRFSVAGRVFGGAPLHAAPAADRRSEAARDVAVPLRQRLGRFVRLQLHFAARWMLISEVSFDSAVVDGNFTAEEEEEDVVSAAVDSAPAISPYLAVVVGALAGTVVLVLAAAALVCVQQRRRRRRHRRQSTLPRHAPDKAALYHDHPDPEYAVPLQTAARAPPQVRDFLPPPPPAERYYAATEICNAGFTPPPPVRLTRQPRYVRP